MPFKDKDAQRASARKHYENNKPAMVARALEHKRKNREAIRSYIREYLADHPCIDCGEDDLIVLEFDHRCDKEFEIGAAVRKNVSLSRLAAEIAKCDVRCAKCHRRKTYHERGYKHRS